MELFQCQMIMTTLILVNDAVAASVVAVVVDDDDFCTVDVVGKSGRHKLSSVCLCRTRSRIVVVEGKLMRTSSKQIQVCCRKLALLNDLDAIELLLI
jgi:hypothetical protein